MEDTTRDFSFYDGYTMFANEASDQLDEIDMLNVRAFTWSPNPLRFPSTSPSKQYKSLLNWVLLKSHKMFSKFCFTPELSEMGNVHIHGWFIIKDRIKYHKWFIPRCKAAGYVQIKYKNIDEKWFEYIKKDISYMNELFEERLPVPLTNLNYDAYKRVLEKKFKLKNKYSKISQKTILDYCRK